MTLRKLINLFTEATTTAPAPKANAGTAAGYKGSAGAQSIAQASGIKDVNKIKVGQSINLPGGGTYQVQKGDTLDKIARNNPAPAAPAVPASAPAPAVQNKPDADAAAKQNVFAPAAAPAAATTAATTAAPAAAPVPVTDPKPAIDPVVASGQNIGGQFAKAASDKAAQDSFAQISGMAPKLAPAAPAAPTADAPAAAAPTFTGMAGNTQTAAQPKGVFSNFMPGQASGTDNEASTGATTAPAAPTKTYGGGYNPNQVKYAVDQPKDDPTAVKGGFGQPTNIRTDTPDDIAKRGPFGIPKNEDIEESLEEELEEAFNDMLRLSGIQLNEKAVSKQQQKFMGMVHAMQKGEKVKGASKELKKAAKGMSKKDAKDFASTKHKGLPQKISENVVLEAGNNLEHIVTRFKHETKNFLAGHDLDSDLYEALYDYYADAGEMPYGVAKARDGDPFEWVSQHFEDDLAMMGHQRVFQETVMPVMDDTLSELARLAGLHESRVDECGDMGMGQEDSMNISTNMSSDGNKTVTISAQGGDAEALIQMLKLAGMGHMGHNADTEEPVVMVSGDDEMMDEAKQKRITKYSNTPDEEYETVHAITRQGNDLNREKRQYAGKPKLGDNPMAEELTLDEELQSLLDSVLVREEEPTWLQKQPSKSQDEIAADWEARVKADKGGVLPAERGGIRGATNPPPDSQYPPGDKRNMIPRRK